MPIKLLVFSVLKVRELQVSIQVRSFPLFLLKRMSISNTHCSYNCSGPDNEIFALHCFKWIWFRLDV